MVIKPRITIIVKVHRLPNVVTIHLCNPLHNLGVTIHQCNPPQIQGMIILPLILYLAVGRALTQITENLRGLTEERRDLLEMNTGRKDHPDMILEMIDRADQNPEAIQILDMRVAHPTDQVVDQEMIIMEEVIVVKAAAAVVNHHKHIKNTKQ